MARFTCAWGRVSTRLMENPVCIFRRQNSAFWHTPRRVQRIEKHVSQVVASRAARTDIAALVAPAASDQVSLRDTGPSMRQNSRATFLALDSLLGFICVSCGCQAPDALTAVGLRRQLVRPWNASCLTLSLCCLFVQLGLPRSLAQG